MTTASNQRQESWVPTTETFGARLALLRQNMKWPTIKEAALACGLGRQSWSNWEAGKRVLDYQDVCAKISARTGVDRYWLMTGEQQTPPPGTQIPLDVIQEELDLQLPNAA